MTQRTFFSLIDSPWVRCRMIDGSVAELSLRDVFLNLTKIQRLAGESRTQDYAVFRVLLVIFWRAHFNDEILLDYDNPERFLDWWEDAKALLSSAGEDKISVHYLEKHSDRFDLFGETPFMQVTDLRTAKDEYSEVTRIIPEAEGTFFTTRAGEKIKNLGFAESTRWLIAVQAYDFSKPMSAAVGDTRPVMSNGCIASIGTGWTGMTGGVLIIGNNLAETLLLNTPTNVVFSRDQQDDLPVWEREPDTQNERKLSYPTGACDLLTWQARRVRLHHDGDKVTGVLVANGDKILDMGKNIILDPMTAYRYLIKKSPKTPDVCYPRMYDAENTIWRALAPLLLVEGVEIPLKKGEKPSKPPQTFAHLRKLKEYGLSNKQVRAELIGMSYLPPHNSKITNTCNLQIDLPVSVFNENAQQAVDTILLAGRKAQEVAVEIGKYAGWLKQAAGDDYKFDAIQANILLDTLSSRFKEWLGREEFDDIRANDTQMHLLNKWCDTLHITAVEKARQLIVSAGPAALSGRVIDGNLLNAGICEMRLLRGLKNILDSNRKEKQ